MNAPAEDSPTAHLDGCLVRGLVFAILIVLCGAPATVVLLREGDVAWATGFGVITALAIAVLVAVGVIAIRTARAMRASGALAVARAVQAEQDRRHVLAGPPPVAVRVSAGLTFLTAALMAAGASLTLVQGVRVGGWAPVLASVYGGLLAMLGLAEFLSGRFLLRRGVAIGGQILNGLLAAFFGFGIINGLVSDSPHKWTAIIALVGASAYFALPAVLLMTPAAKAWLKRHELTAPASPPAHSESNQAAPTGPDPTQPTPPRPAAVDPPTAS